MDFRLRIFIFERFILNKILFDIYPEICLKLLCFVFNACLISKKNLLKLQHKIHTVFDVSVWWH